MTYISQDSLQYLPFIHSHILSGLAVYGETAMYNLDNALILQEIVSSLSLFKMQEIT